MCVIKYLSVGSRKCLKKLIKSSSKSCIFQDMLGIGKFTQMQQPGVPQQPRGPAGPAVPPANRYVIVLFK